MQQKWWWGAFVVVLGAGASVAAWLVVIKPFVQESLSFEVMVCSGENCSADSVKAYAANGTQIMNLTSGLTQVAAAPGLSAGADILEYSCFYKDNLEMLDGSEGNPGFGAITISSAPGKNLYVSSKNRGGNLHMPIAIQVVYASPRLDPIDLLEPKQCVRP